HRLRQQRDGLARTGRLPGGPPGLLHRDEGSERMGQRGRRLDPATSRRRAMTARAAGLVAVLGVAPAANAQEIVTTLAPIKVSRTTGEKPQSKLWLHAGRWWAVLPSTSVTPAGTWLWRLEADKHWTAVLRLSSSTSTKADAKALGDVTHVLLHGKSPEL